MAVSGCVGGYDTRARSLRIETNVEHFLEVLGQCGEIKGRRMPFRVPGWSATTARNHGEQKPAQEEAQEAPARIDGNG